MRSLSHCVGYAQIAKHADTLQATEIHFHVKKSDDTARTKERQASREETKKKHEELSVTHKSVNETI